MGLIGRITTFLEQTTITAAAPNAELNQILAVLNGGIENINVRDGAGIRQDQGKLVLDYDEIRTQLYTGASNWLDGAAILNLSVALGKMKYAANTLSAVGLFMNTDPGSFPWTIPANTFSDYMLVLWGATMDTVDDASGPEKQLAMQVDGNTLTTAKLGIGKQEVQSEAGSAGTRTQSTNMFSCYISVTSSNSYTTNPPTIDRAQSHTLDITEITSYSANVTQKHLLVLGR